MLRQLGRCQRSHLCADEVLQERFQACMQVVGRVGCTDDDESQASHAKGKPRAAVHRVAQLLLSAQLVVHRLTQQLICEV
eukprot:CAMPEP_0202340608 /NCGR_PEP_ID=MMETSP1126-20121109/1975_1 /ASSEMBLY_ACC=CAM_ASM_000457 /TAXON_ID=3047 /ORGANISM="Dunaliella tertiolecta, Strain CCMP1320" /LENGTH=79 /DNA_ID=CAMNT_0048931339 /DNA_START=787 /DNA_END=1026 /DNA_ORIENTATION=+